MEHVCKGSRFTTYSVYFHRDMMSDVYRSIRYFDRAFHFQVSVLLESLSGLLVSILASPEHRIAQNLSSCHIVTSQGLFEVLDGTYVR